MPSKAPASYAEDNWTEDLPVCDRSGVGFSTNVAYRLSGPPVPKHEFEDESMRIKHDVSGVSLYGVFDGFEGKHVAEYASKRLPADLLFELTGKTSDTEVKESLRQAFHAVEAAHLKNIGDTLARRAELLSHIQGETTYEASQRHPEILNQLAEVNDTVRGGSSAVVALVRDGKLYVGNIGNCRALLAKKEGDGLLRVHQLSVQHDTTNADEALRLKQLGLGDQIVRSISYCTRSLGDFPKKGGYKDFEENLQGAADEPVISEPEIFGGIPLDDSCQFLILMSAGVYLSLEDATGADQVNRDIVQMIAREFSVQSSLSGVAQAVVDLIGRIHHDAFQQADTRQFICQSREDMTVLIVNFHYPLPNEGVSTNQLYLGPTSPGPDTTLSTAYTTRNDSPPAGRTVLPLDDSGRIAPYVDFSDFYATISRLAAPPSPPPGPAAAASSSSTDSPGERAVKFE